MTHHKHKRLGWWARRQRRKRCFHQSWPLGTSYISSELIDLGRAKLFWCDVRKGGCGKTWM